MPKFAFFGTPRFAAIILKNLLDSHLVPATLVCNPDRPVGRKQIITPPATKELLQSKGLEDKVQIIQPENLKLSLAGLDSSFDFFIVAAYAKIIPREILILPRLGVVGVHPSLLPLYRGPSPIQSVLLAGEKETGLTLYLLDEKMDHGPILTQRVFRIRDGETYQTLEEALAILGAELLAGILPNFPQGNITVQEQEEERVTYTRKLASDDAFVEEKDLEEALGGDMDKALEIERKVRALNPEPGVWTFQSGKRVKLLEVALSPDGALELTLIQVEGGIPAKSVA